MGSPIIRKYHLLLTAALVASLPVISYPATIKGVVKNQMTRVNIESALIILLRPADSDYYQSAVSDASGRFALADIRSGEYYLEVRKDGFFSNALFDLEVTTDEDYTVKIKLLPSEGKQGSEYSFMLGGIEVKADRIDVIPDEIATTRKIDSGEIEHMQATNLGDVLALIPGVEKNTSPGLAKPVSVGIRSVRSGGGYIEGVEAFGTTIIVDGDCISNDINAKQKGGIGETGSSGIDLRGIPADNIKSVEVITGVPSVEYGNFARGLILVETKIGVTSPKLKAKLNPDTKSVSFSAGHQVGRTVFDYFLDYGYSERNLREEGDNYQRFYVKGNIARKFIDEKLDLKLRSSYTKRIDSEEPTGDRQLKQYNDGYRASGKIDATYQVNENDKVIGSLSINHENKQYYREKWVNEQLVTPDSIYFGYVGIAEEIGTEWDITGRLKMKGVASGRWFDHKYHIGLEVDYEENNGIGLVLDTLFNYYGVYSTKRSYSFDAYPAYRDFAIYCEDNISGMLLARKFQIELGLRYDVFNPTGVNWGNIWEDKSLLNTRFGEFLLPRVNMRYFINDDLRIRVGAGKFPKRISLAHIYRAAAFVKIFRDSVFVEESYSQANPDLQTYTTNKYEVSVDWRPIDLIGLSLTAYHSETSNRPQTVSYPWGYDFNPDTLTSESYAIYENRGWNRSSGLEFSLRTKRIANMLYRLNVTYRFSESGRTGYTYDSSPDTTWEDIWYLPTSAWREKIILDNQLSYISQRLGIWLTLEVQNIMNDHKLKEYHSARTIKEIQELNGAEHIWYQGMTYWYETEFYDYMSHWVANFRLTKSILTSTEISLYINNILDDRARWHNPYDGYDDYFNSPIYYGLEISTQW